MGDRRRPSIFTNGISKCIGRRGTQQRLQTKSSRSCRSGAKSKIKERRADLKEVSEWISARRTRDSKVHGHGDGVVAVVMWK